MSLQSLEEVKCPCGEAFETEIYQSVSVGDDPELKDLILGGEFNMVECPGCNRIIYAERFVLYHDREQELMAFVYPYGKREQGASMAEEMRKTFESLQVGLPEGEKLPYKPIMLFGMDELCQVLTEDDEITDEAEIAGHLCKSLGLKPRKISKAFARQMKIPFVLPLRGEVKQVRENLIGDLEKILKENDRLAHYQKLLAHIKSDPNWSI
jgi:hypothetical protein